jgi:hypothetical protein
MNVIWKEPRPKLCTCSTNWQLFQEIINNNIRLNHRIKETQELEEVAHYLTKLIQEAAWQATPPPTIGTREPKHTSTPSRTGSGK